MLRYLPPLLAAVLAVQPLAAAADTQAVCDLLHPFTRYVGTDAKCTDSTIQSAIDAVPINDCPKTIVVTQELSYSAQHLTIGGKTFKLAGAGTGIGCGTTALGTPTSPQVTLSGSGNGGNSVIDIGGAGNHITLQYLEMTAGSRGISFDGSGSVTLDTSTIDHNSADYGGGIEVNGATTLAAATLTLAAYSVVESNTADFGDGGGISLSGNAQLVATQPNTIIGFNHAPRGNGGGLVINAPAVATIASPGYGALGVIYGNDALRGGGVAVQSSIGNNQATLNLYSTDPLNLVVVADNVASIEGGGIYLKALAQTSEVSNAVLCADAFHIDGNSAPDGSAIYSDTDSSSGASPKGGIVSIGPSAFCSAPPAAAVSCAAGLPCNTLSGNVTQDSSSLTAGSIVGAQDGSLILASAATSRFEMRNNTSGHAFGLTGVSSALHTCLIAGNTFSAETFVIDSTGNGFDTTVVNCTIANNANNSGSVFRTGQNLTIDATIIDQPAMAAVSTVGTPAIFADDVLAADPTGLPVQANIVQGEPMFRNVVAGDFHAAGDYHQQVFKIGNQVTASLGVDFAPPVAGDDRDLDGNPYDQDVPAVADYQGVRDLGCYEAQPITDRVFGDAFGDPLSLVY